MIETLNTISNNTNYMQLYFFIAHIKGHVHISFQMMYLVPTELKIDSQCLYRYLSLFVKMALIYGCETWTITTKNMTSLQSFEM